MQKIKLLGQIQELSSILASDKTLGYISENSVAEMQKALDMMTEEYLQTYCAA